MTREQLEDFLEVIAEIRKRNCVIPEQVFHLLREAGVYDDSGNLTEPYRSSTFIPSDC